MIIIEKGSLQKLKSNVFENDKTNAALFSVFVLLFFVF